MNIDPLIATQEGTAMHKQAKKFVHIVLRPLQPRFDAKFSNYTSHTLGRRWFNINPFLPQNNTVRTYAMVMHKAKKKGSVRCTRSQVPPLISNCISNEFSKRYSQHQSCSQHLPPFRPRFLDAPKAKTEWQYERKVRASFKSF